MKTEINKAWSVVNESFVEIWRPIVDSIGIPYPTCADWDFEKILNAQCKHFDDNLWNGLTAILKKSIDSIAMVSQSETYLRIGFPDIPQDLFSICFNLQTCDSTAMGTVDPDEINGKFRLEVIDYLTKKELIPSFQYVDVEIHAGEILENRLIGRDCTNIDFCEYIGAIVDGLLQTPIVYSLLKRVQNKVNERQRLIKVRELAKRQEDERLAKAFANIVKPHIENVGCKDQWRVYKEFCNFVMELQLTDTDLIRYSSSDQDDIISIIPALVNFANDYRVLNAGQGQFCVLKDWDIIIT